MQLKRTVIALCLLLAYSAGFAHDLIPHCHHEDGSDAAHTEVHETHNHNHHAHHDHQHEQEDHEHIQHEDHVDDGLLDFIICVFSASEHHDAESEHCYYLPAKTSDGVTSWLLKMPVASLLSFDALPDGECVFNFVSKQVVLYDVPFLANLSTRGPPSVSC